MALIWDIRNKCWLRHTTGYKANSLARTQSGALYTGHYDGKIYKQDVSSASTDASETSPGAIDAYWSSCWHKFDSLTQGFSLGRLNVALTSQTSGFLNVGYGFNYVSDIYSEQKLMQAVGALWDSSQWDVGIWGIQSDIIRNLFTKGRGVNYQISFGNNTASNTFEVHGYSLLISKSGQKTFSTR